MLLKVDPNAPKMATKVAKKHRDWWKVIEIVSLLIASFGLMYSVHQFDVAKQALEDSRHQFLENSKSSDEQFAKISRVLENYQQTSENSLATSKSQLQETNRLLYQIEFLGKPNLIIEKASVEMTPNPTKFSNNVLIHLLVTNAGFRPLNLREGYLYLVSSQSEFTPNGFHVQSFQTVTLNSDNLSNNKKLITFPTRQTSSFEQNEVYYYCFKFKFTDLNQEDVQEVAYFMLRENGSNQLDRFPEDDYNQPESLSDQYTQGQELHNISNVAIIMNMQLAIKNFNEKHKKAVKPRMWNLIEVSLTRSIKKTA